MERPPNKDFIDLTAHPSLGNFFLRIKKDFPFKSKEEPPFTQSWFWNEMSKVDFPVYQINQKLRLYITAWAGQEQFSLFHNDGKRNFKRYIYTRIRNKAIEIYRLPAFSTLFSNLRTGIRCGRFLSIDSEV